MMDANGRAASRAGTVRAAGHRIARAGARTDPAGELTVAVRPRGSERAVGAALGLSVHLPGRCGAQTGASGVAIIYLHGGGMLFGERDDLPDPYIKQITDRGHVLICLDYPLAPQIAAAGIIDAVSSAVTAIAASRLAALGCTRYVLFGRSAGAYLALMATSRLRERGARPPLAVWDFYGYDDLRAAFVSAPNRRYRAMPAVDERTVAGMLDMRGGAPLTCAAKETRFALYVYARQTGRWAELLGADAGAKSEGSARLGLTEGDIAELPPLFIAASTADEDVPFAVSKRLSRRAPVVSLDTVYYLEHDFDRDLTIGDGARSYAVALDFLDSCSRAPDASDRSG